MAGQKGREVLIKTDVGSVQTTIGGGRAKSISLNSGMVDITDADSSGRFRELLASAGVQSVSLSLSGVFKDSAAEAQCIGDALTGGIRTMNFVMPGLGTFAGSFQMTQCQLNGNHDGEAQYSMAWESAGEVTFA